VNRNRTLWIDLENAPQVQYLLPVAQAAWSLGADVIVTARDYGETFTLLDDRSVSYRKVGEVYGPSTIAKGRGVIRRVRSLVGAVGSARPDVLVCASRAAVIAARIMRIPSYAILDYEFVDTRIFRLAHAIVLHPDVIPTGVLSRQGLASHRLVPFRGLKEDLTFANVDPEAAETADLGPDPGDMPRVLIRPAAEESHYFRAESRALALRALEHLAGQDVQVVFSPRYERQARDLEQVDWTVPPLLLRRPLPFVSLLKAVDAVLCSGGTMFREAAYLGIPAYSIFQGKLGAVDLHLEALGRAYIIRSAAELSRIRIERRSGPLSPMRSNPALADEIARRVLDTNASEADAVARAGAR
jgi:predicted glycosyltransferase